MMGYKTPATATARWGELKKKVFNADVAAASTAEAGGEGEVEAEGGKATPKGKGGAKGKKRKAEDVSYSFIARFGRYCWLTFRY